MLVVRGKNKLSPGSKRGVGRLGVTLCPSSYTVLASAALTSLLPIPFVRYYTVDAAGTISSSSDRALAATVFC